MPYSYSKEPYTHWWIAKRPCGRLQSVCPQGPDNQRHVRDRIRQWRDLGLIVSSVPVKDPLPPDVCAFGKPCACRDADAAAGRRPLQDVEQ